MAGLPALGNYTLNAERVKMWYAIWTTTGAEGKLCEWIKDCISDSLYEDCFVPIVEQNRKFKGEWKIFKKPLFPGYLFVKTGEDKIMEFAKKLKNTLQFAMILSTEGKYTPIKESETYLIEGAYNNNGTLGTSIGMIEGDEIKIISGPLIGMEGAIRSINRHKRTAIIELKLFGRTSKLTIGLDIRSK